MYWVLCGMIIAAMLVAIGYNIYKKFPHTDTSGCATPDPNAEIISIKSEISGRKVQSMVATTKVIFSDGFIYTSPKTRSMQNSLLSWHVYIDAELKAEIAMDAVKAHEKYIQKRIKNS